MMDSVLQVEPTIDQCSTKSTEEVLDLTAFHEWW